MSTEILLAVIFILVLSTLALLLWNWKSRDNRRRREFEQPGGGFDGISGGSDCPLCGEHLPGGTRVHSVLFPGKEFDLMRIYGCRHCWSGHASADPSHQLHSRRCPYCGDRLRKYEVPHSAFEIDYWYEADYLYICFNDACPYFERGWEWMWSKMRRNVSYRHMYNPTTHKSGPIPVPTNYALRDGIVEET